MTDYVPEESLIKLLLAIFINIIRLVLFPIFSLIIGIPLYFCWNFVMPEFGLPVLTYFQTTALLLVFSWLMPTHYHPMLWEKK